VDCKRDYIFSFAFVAGGGGGEEEARWDSVVVGDFWSWLGGLFGVVRRTELDVVGVMEVVVLL